jgi:hypothetical protein
MNRAEFTQLAYLHAINSDVIRDRTNRDDDDSKLYREMIAAEATEWFSENFTESGELK